MVRTMAQSGVLSNWFAWRIVHRFPYRCNGNYLRRTCRDDEYGINSATGNHHCHHGTLYLNCVLPDLSEPFSSLPITSSESSLPEVIQAWLISSVKLSAMIFAIIYTLMFVQRLMEKYGLMQKLVRPLAPLMVFFGLPKNAAYLWLVGNVLGISYGSAVMMQLQEEGKITRKEADEVNYHLIMNHSMLEDTLVFATAGVSALWILSTRLLFALILVWSRKALKTVVRS